MIILYFLIDFVICNLLSVFTYFIVIDIDGNSLFDVLSVGILLDCLYGRLFINTILLVVLYYLIRLLKVKNKYRFLKNVLVYFVCVLIGIYL